MFFRRIQYFLPLEGFHPALVILATALSLFCLASPATAQPGGTAKPEAIPAPEDIALTTKDGLQLKATYFASKKGKQAVPVVLLHMFEGSGGDFRELALGLQGLGHAVVVPDLRGHGGSTEIIGARKPLDAKTLSKRDFFAMVSQDMEAVKRFLLEKNDEEELNVEKLCLVGAEMGANVALDWARLDWSWPKLATGKQGQDVKALVLISPQWSFRGLSAQPAVAHPAVRSELSIMIIVGEGDRAAERDAVRLKKAFERYHPDPPKEKWVEEKDFWYIPLKTNLQGTKMLGVNELQIGPYIARFIEYRIVNKTFSWQERTMAY